MTELTAFMCAAIIIEGLISYAAEIYKNKKIQWQIIAAIAIGCLLAFNLKLDIFSILGIEEINTAIGTVLTGILISRGSNYVFELYDRLTNWKQSKGEE